MTKEPLIILTGPTAVGKTALSLSLAERVNGEIISADSMQVYRGMDIGSAKIMPEEQKGIPHHLIDVLDPDEEFHVVRFVQMAKEAMEDIRSRGKVPILTGGTGFYIQAMLYDIDFTESGEDDSYRRELETYAKEQGAEKLHEEVDPISAEKIHANNVKRVIRALEYYKQTGEPISRHNEQERQKESPYAFAYFVLNDKRDRLYQRIDARIDEMLLEGLVAEVEKLKEKGCHRGMVSMQGLGYKEILAYLNGTSTLEEAIYIIKRESRHFAKRQLTWFRRERDVIWLNKPNFEYDDTKILTYMMDVLQAKGILPA